MIIVTPAGIIVVETYLNDHTACQARNLIVQTMPNVPIKYVVTTSHHGDHIYGNSVFVAEGVKFVMHKNTFTYISDEALPRGREELHAGWLWVRRWNPSDSPYHQGHADAARR